MPSVSSGGTVVKDPIRSSRLDADSEPIEDGGETPKFVLLLRDLRPGRIKRRGNEDPYALSSH